VGEPAAVVLAAQAQLKLLPRASWPRRVIRGLAPAVRRAFLLNQPFAGYAAYCDDVVRHFFARCERAFLALAG